MRKIYYLFLTMLLGMVGMTANAAPINVTVKVDKPENVKVQLNWEDQTLSDGQIQLTVEESYGSYQCILIKPNTGVYAKIEKNLNGERTLLTSNYIYPTASDDGAEYSVTTATETDRTGQCTINIDEPGTVSYELSTNYSRGTLSESTNVINYIPGFDVISFMPVTYGNIIYSAKSNDVLLEKNQYDYFTKSLDGASTQIDIQYSAPADAKQKVTISYVDESKADGFITKVLVNDEEISKELYLSKRGFEVAWGAVVMIYGDVSNYKVANNTIKINDIDSYFSGSIRFNATEDKNIVIDAEKYAQINAKLIIDNIDNVIISRNKETIEGLTSGENDILVNEQYNTIVIKPSADGKIKSVKANNQEITESYPGSGYSITITEGMTINVETEVIERNNKLIVYIDDLSCASYGYSISIGSYPNSRTLTVQSGYNVFSFDNDEVFNASFYTNGSYFSYRNGEQVNAIYETVLVDGDVFKFFLASTAAPTANDVTFTLSGDELTASDVTVTYDRVKTLSDLTAGLSAFAGTEVSISANNNKVIEVKVNGVAVKADTEGVFTFTVSAKTTVEIKDVTPTGINSINAENADNSFYTLQGVKVNGKAKGLYIKNGKKVVVK